MKLLVYFMTGVMSLFAEALHTLSDIFVSGFLLVAATLFISFTSFKLYEEAIPRLFAPEEASYQNLNLALGVLVLSMFIAAIPLIKLFTQKKKGAAAKAQLMELFNDELGLIARSSAHCSLWGA